MKFRLTFFPLPTILLLSLLLSCAPQPPISSPGHLKTSDIPLPKEDIPPLVQQRPFVPPPQPTLPLETFTVVVESVPIDKLLFALARDTGLNVDIHPGIKGNVTLNAIDQTFPQLLERIANQVNLRYQIKDNHLIISPDLPYMRLYKVGYVNMSRDSKSDVTVATQIASTGRGISENSSGGGGGGGNSGGGGGDSAGNNSITKITNESKNRFWETLEKNIQAILANSSATEVQVNLENNVIINSETGIMNVWATHRQHEDIRHFLDQVLISAQRQVLIEATIAEVKLSDRYQAGIDWQRIAGDFSYTQAMTTGNMGQPPFYSITYNNSNSQFGNISATVRLLEQFGTVKVLSSPKIMALNNQTAILKIVDNVVYFTTEIDISESESRVRETFSTEINTIPVGLVMSVTPQISENDAVILNIRPTISRILGYKNDPNPLLAEAGTVNLIPEIQVREIESILKINNNDIAIIGGLMQDITDNNMQGIPLLSQLPVIGSLFNYRDDKYTKTELVIFLRPVVVKEASLTGDLRDYQAYLPH